MKSEVNLRIWVVCVLFVLSGIPLAAKQVILTATGDPTIDTDQLEWKLNHLLTGDTLLLTGHFKLERMLVLHGFDGIIKGQGMDVTTIEVTGNNPGSFPSIYDGDNVFLFHRTPGTSVTIKDLTIYYDGGVENPFGDPLPMVAFINDNDCHESQTLIKNVCLATEEPTIFQGVSSWHSIPLVEGGWAPGPGNTTVEGCRIFGFGVAVRGGYVDDGAFVVRNNEMVGNNKAVEIFSIPNGKLSILNNEIIDVQAAIRVRNVHGNTIIKDNRMTGIGKQAFYLQFSSRLQIKNNLMKDYTGEFPFWGCIFIRGSWECTIEGNTFANLEEFGAGIAENHSSGLNKYIGNTFVDTRFHHSAIEISGRFGLLKNNVFVDSGIPGGDVLDPHFYSCVFLEEPSSMVLVRQPVSLLPVDNPDPGEQIIDWGVDGTNVVNW